MRKSLTKDPGLLHLIESEKSLTDVSFTESDKSMYGGTSVVNTNFRQPPLPKGADLTGIYIESSPSDIKLPATSISSQTFILPPGDTLPVILKNRFPSSDSVTTSSSATSNYYPTNASSTAGGSSFFSLASPNAPAYSSTVGSTTPKPSILAGPPGMPGPSSYPSPDDLPQVESAGTSSEEARLNNINSMRNIETMMALPEETESEREFFKAARDSMPPASHYDLKSINGTSNFSVNGTPLQYSR